MMTVIECNKNVGGLCLAPCSYQPPKVVKRHAPKKKVMVKKPTPAPKEKEKMQGGASYRVTRLRPAGGAFVF